MDGAFPKKLGQNLMSTEVDIGKTEKQEYRYLLAKKSSKINSFASLRQTNLFSLQKAIKSEKVGGAKLKVGGANAPPTIV